LLRPQQGVNGVAQAVTQRVEGEDSQQKKPTGDRIQG
jgi:hypothetical protein